MSETIEEASAQLDAAVRAVRSLPMGESPPGTAKVLAHYERKKRALALAVLRECSAAEEEHPGSHWLAILGRIEALGQ